jgi:hypothetical protein
MEMSTVFQSYERKTDIFLLIYQFFSIFTIYAKKMYTNLKIRPHPLLQSTLPKCYPYPASPKCLSFGGGADGGGGRQG